MDEKPDGQFVHFFGLGKGERFAREARESLAQGAVESFDVIGLPIAFAARSVLRWRHDGRVCAPVVGVDGQRLPSGRQRRPELARRVLIASAEPVGQNAPRAATKRQP